MKPLIGLSGVYDPSERVVRVRNGYMECIYAAGGVPVLLPLLSKNDQIGDIVARLDGVVFTGGGDVSPCYYGETLQTECDQTEPERDVFELALFSVAFQKGLPMLGICRGVQLIAVACGGKLIQNVSNHSGGISHDVVVYSGMLREICGASVVRTNSYHMQAVAELSSDSPLLVCARATDGTIEGICHKSHPFCLGVQWHPERLAYSDAASLKIFSSLVSACSR